MTGDGRQTLVASDIFLGLAAILLMVFAMISGNVRSMVQAAEAEARAARQRADPADTAAALAGLVARTGQAAAHAGGQAVVLMAPGQAPRTIGTDDLFDAPALDDWVAAAGPSPLVVIGADSFDTAFLLESALARAGLGTIRRIRLGTPCAALLPAPDGGLICLDAAAQP